MSSNLLRIAAAAFLVLGVACGDDGSSGGGDGGSGDGDGDDDGNSSTSDGVTLTVRSVALSSDAIEGSAPDPNDTFVFVEVELENDSDGSIPLAATSFAVKDDEGVEYHGDPLTEVLADGCDESASVSPDGEATCTVVFAAPKRAELEKLVYEWDDGRVEASLGGADGGGGGAPVGSCAQAASGAWVAAFSVQLINEKPLFFDVAVTGSEGGLTLSMTPLRTPYREGSDNEGIPPMTPVGSSFTLHTSALGPDGEFILETGPDLNISGLANPFSPNDLVATLTLEGRACPDDAEGAFCGTISGEVTKPIPLALDGQNTFAFNEQTSSTLVYSCEGDLADPF